MAKKGQTFKRYTKESKEEILKKYYEGVPTSILGKEYNISPKTIENWIHKTKYGKDVLVDHRQFNTGRPKKEDKNIDYKERYEILKKYQAFLKAQREKK